MDFNNFQKITPYLWEIPRIQGRGMRVPGRIYISEVMLKTLSDERSAEQLANVATLPGIEKYALAMPDIHQGYGFPIGGVAAMRVEDGVISPGGVGYDINCGVRLLVSDYTFKELEPVLTNLANQMQRDVPSGVGRGGRIVLNDRDMDEVLHKGIVWALKEGYALKEDQAVIEEQGTFKNADPDLVSQAATSRGRDQLGTLGAGNHFVEIQRVADIFDANIAQTYELFEDQVVVMIHTGSRGLGHQICTDYVRMMNTAMRKYGIVLPDRELACVPFQSSEGQQYFQAMMAGANFAWVNRQVITYLIRQSWQRILGEKKNHLRLVYDVGHNMAKLEEHEGKQLVVHRKGATRAFGPGLSQVPERYRAVGQPVLIPGSMGTASYVLAGTEKAMQETFGSCCHGAGRQMSRAKAKSSLDYQQLVKELEEKGIVIRAGSVREVLEEAPQAYKDVDQVIEVVRESGLAKVVARMRPLAVMKG